MRHVMRAEYAATAEGREAAEGTDEATGREPSGPWPVKTWHMVREGEESAMCGRELRPDARSLSDEEWGRTPEPFCHTCGALYLREVP
ncbi:hypothetical protein FH609_019700 [Streptomyces sp. 3MP-14]|uniref:Uncharacterized protein n=1 Tax=Streptomyces mimosae TaxID=2586635 RepID=A0A5N6A8R4_9ACTN|nr:MULTISPECIES: hypothetical protein [Streptomyces]KAB8163868.1 hypothetical protein FH607_018240 [Streptomyces mimosae]KAB8175311.1 hypothetical protein FH609_019700 [Streptomyces sp. 3MP-14]